jgi:hypothetical protein
LAPGIQQRISPYPRPSAVLSGAAIDGCAGPTHPTSVQQKKSTMTNTLPRLLGSLILWTQLGGLMYAAEAEPQLRSIHCQNYTLKQLRQFSDQQTRGFVFFFLKPDCPAAELTLHSLKDLQTELAAESIEFYAVYSNSGIHVRNMASHALEMEIPFRVLLDVDQQLAREWGVTRTAEVVFTDESFQVLYQGAVDDQVGIGTTREQATQHYLRDAIAHWLSDGSIPVSRTAAPGCVLESSEMPLREAVTFHKDVLPILQRSCQKCHREGEAAPMPLGSYADAFNFAAMIEEVVVDRRMPPWPAESPRPLKGDHRLSEDEVRTIVSWVQGGRQEGDPGQGPPPVRWPSAEEWKIGEPDAIFETPSYQIPASGIVPYIYHRVPLELGEDRWIQAIEIKPGSRRAVHHITVYEFPAGDDEVTAADILRIYGLELSDTVLGAYVPGLPPMQLPPDAAARLRGDMGVLFEMHYTPFGKPTTDVSRIGIKFSKTPPKMEVKSQWFYRSRARFEIPAQARHHRMQRDDIFFEKDVEILGMRPHLHARGQDFLVEKVDARTDQAEKLLAIPRWDFNWQLDYYFEKPIVVRGGEELRITAHWDNTAFNPMNPDPSTDVYFGQQTTDEMMGVLLIYRELPQPAATESAAR